MNTSTFRSALLALAATLAPVALHAQASHTISVVNVPFAFQDGNKTFPAGTYTLIQSSDHILNIQGKVETGLLMTTFSTANDKGAATSKVVFHQYGNQYFLSEVWAKGQSEHTVAYKTAAETRAMKAASQDASLATPATSVEVAVLNSAH